MYLTSASNGRCWSLVLIHLSPAFSRSASSRSPLTKISLMLSSTTCAGDPGNAARAISFSLSPYCCTFSLGRCVLAAIVRMLTGRSSLLSPTLRLSSVLSLSKPLVWSLRMSSSRTFFNLLLLMCEIAIAAHRCLSLAVIVRYCSILASQMLTSSWPLNSGGALISRANSRRSEPKTLLKLTTHRCASLGKAFL